MTRRLIKQKNESARELAKTLHDQMLRDNPDYRKQWEEVCATWRTVLADADIPDEDAP